MLGTIRVLIENDGLSISNPGSFVEGVTVDNLISVEPRWRNPQLAAALHRIGLVERTGRGIDRIYAGLLRYGRPEPDYSESDHTIVKVWMSGGKADFEFIKMLMAEEEAKQEMLDLASLIVLAALKEQRRLSISDLARRLHYSEERAKAVLERLKEAGLVESHGATRAFTYTLSSAVYKQRNEKVEYIRQLGITKIQQEQMVLSYAEENGMITRGIAMSLCRISRDQASALLRKLRDQGKLEQRGSGRSSRYVHSGCRDCT